MTTEGWQKIRIKIQNRKSYFVNKFYFCIRDRGISSSGRASGSQSEGGRFESDILHKRQSTIAFCVSKFQWAKARFNVSRAGAVSCRIAPWHDCTRLLKMN